jgi:hypothetical protein
MVASLAIFKCNLDIMGEAIIKKSFPENKDKSATTSRAGGMRKAPRRGRGNALLVVADLINSIYKPPASFRFRSIIRDPPVTEEPFQFSPAEAVAYEWS